MLEALKKDHRLLAALAERIEACLDDESPLAATRLGQLRCRLAHEAIRHTIVEDRLVYRALENDDRRLLYGHCKTFPCLRTDRFLRHLQEYIHRWDAPAVQGDRQHYAAATREMMALLRTRMELEEHVLYPCFHALQARIPRTRKTRRRVRHRAEARRHRIHVENRLI